MKDRQEEPLVNDLGEQGPRNGTLSQVEQKLVNCDDSEVREVAAQVVCDVIYRATEEAQKKQSRSDEDDNDDVTSSSSNANAPPEIQIDLVGSRTPSPEEEPCYLPPLQGQSYCKRFTNKNDDEDDAEPSPDNAHRIPETKTDRKGPCEADDLRNDPELKEFALSYVKGIVEQATVLAAERAPSKLEEFVPGHNLKKATGPWYSRFRLALTRCLRISCFCVVRRQPS